MSCGRQRVCCKGLCSFMVNDNPECSFEPDCVGGSETGQALVSLFRRRNFQKGGNWTEWSEKDGNTRCSFHCNCLIRREVARPERFELPAFWFVARSAKTSKCRYWYRLRATRATLFCP